MMDYCLTMSKTIEDLFRRQHIGTCLLEFERLKAQFQVPFLSESDFKMCFTIDLRVLIPCQVVVNSNEI